MATRSRGPLAGFGWLKKAINLGHGNPKAVFGGALLVLVLAMLPSLLTLPMQLGTVGPGQAPARMGAAMAVSMLAGLLMVPAFAGYLRILDAAEHGRPARALDVFGPYRQGETLRFVGYGLAMLVVYAAMFAAIVAIAGRGVADWYLQALSAQAGAVPADGLPEGFGTAVAMACALGLLVMGIYAISLGQVALRGRGVMAAIGDGLAGSLKNVLPLLVFAISALLAWIVVVIAFGLLAMLLVLLGKLVADWLMLVLVVPLYIGLMLVAFTVMFGVMYHLWRDVCAGEGAAPEPGEPFAA
jgi:hypothetical protein